MEGRKKALVRHMWKIRTGMEEEEEEEEGEGEGRGRKRREEEEEEKEEARGTVKIVLTRICMGITKGLMASFMSSSVTAISVWQFSSFEGSGVGD